MKIALCCPNFPPEFTGGTELVSRALAHALQRLGDEVVVIAGSDAPHRGVDVEREELDGIAVRRLRRTSDEGYGLDVERPRLRALLTRLYDDEAVDVVHVQHWSTLSDHLVRDARATGRRVVVTLHDLWTTCPRFFRSPPAGIRCPTGAGRDACAPCAAAGLAMPVSWCVEHLGLRDADLRAELAAAHARTVPSRITAERLGEHLPWDVAAFEIVPHGLLQPVGANVAVPPAPSGALRVGTFGNLVEPKGVMLLVYACRDVPGIELHLYGPFLDAEFERLVRERAHEFGVVLHCHGRYGPDTAHPARSLDVAVFPSLCEETYGLVVEESLARGVPVIVSDRGALGERIGHGGVIVDVDEVGPLQRELTRLATDRAALARMRLGIPAKFATIDDAAQRYRRIYSGANSVPVAPNATNA